jgi:hypothetical protein
MVHLGQPYGDSLCPDLILIAAYTKVLGIDPVSIENPDDVASLAAAIQVLLHLLFVGAVETGVDI